MTQQTDMTDETIYLDFNATTPVAPEVVDAMEPYLSERFGNPSSQHPYGRRARRAVERAREQIAEVIGCGADELLFTGSGTEANNLALRGVVGALDSERVVISAVEHPSVEAPCQFLEAQGVEVTRVGVDERGAVDLAELERTLDESVDLVSVMHANNEVGTIEPIPEIVELADAVDALVHTDASQTVGKIPVTIEKLGVDLLTITGHKFYGPKGVGALFVREGVELEPVLRGAGHERGLRPGTENVPAIVGLGEACVDSADRLDERRRQLRARRDQLWALLREEGGGAVTRHVPFDVCLPNTLNLRFAGVRGSELLEEADLVAASTGSACHEGGVAEPSAVLTAMGVPAEEALGAIRLSVGETTTEEDVERAAEALLAAVR